MTTLASLLSAATLKGYLMATNAPAEIIAMAEGIIAGGMKDVPEPGIEEYPPLHFRTPPMPIASPAAPAVIPSNPCDGAAENAPRPAPAQPMPNAAPETALAEANDSSGTVDSQKSENAPMTTGGGGNGNHKRKSETAPEVIARGVTARA